MSKYNVLLVFAACVAANLSGCSIVGQPHYNITVKNISDIDLDNVTVSTDVFVIPFGVLPPQISKSNVDHIGPFPHRAQVRWRTPGPAYMPTLSDNVSVPSERPKLIPGGDQEYDLLFELDGEHVTARYVVNDYSKIRDYVRQFKEDQKRQRSDKN